MKQHLCIYLALLVGVPSLASGQRELQHAPPDTANPALSSAARDTAEGLIQLDVVVTDATGNPISGLNKSDFTLLENGRSQNIISFQAVDGRGSLSEPPAKIILVIDTIDLPESLAREERFAVTSYLRKGGGQLAHPVSVFSLTETGLWTVAPSNDGNVLAREIEHNNFTLLRHNVGWQRGPVPAGLKPTASETVLKTLAQIAAEERIRPGRKLLLWIGPGWGIGSGAYADAAPRSPPVFDTVLWFSALLREAHLVLYSFTVGETDPHAQLYKAYLDGVASPHKASFIDRK